MLEQIAQEHKRLHEMIDSLSAVVRMTSNENIMNDGLSIISDRLKLHFDVEERVLVDVDAEICSLMHSDHQIILSKIESIRAHISAPRNAFLSALNDVSMYMDRHDRELDWPVFHYVNTQQLA